MRIKSLQILVAICFIFLAACLFYLQIIKGSVYRAHSNRNSIRLLNIQAARGDIYDRFGRSVAGDNLSFGVYIVPQEAKELDSTIAFLSEILGISETDLKRSYKRNYLAPFAPCELAKPVPKEKAIIIEEMKLNMPGVLIKVMPVRYYPYKEATAHLVGYLGEIDKRELDALKSYGYTIKDIIGKDGVERIVDDILRGANGGMQVQVDNRGKQAKVLNLKDPVKGEDVSLTIDVSLQNFVWRMMKQEKGAAIFMDPHTGEILSLVSTPSFDPNSSVADVLYDRDAPLLNRAIAGQYPPGSLFKICVALAGLESGKLRPETTFVCPGSLSIGNMVFNCWNQDGHGPMELRNAIAQSCNVYFYNVGLTVGVDDIHAFANKLGFGKKTGIDLPGEAGGFVPSRRWKIREREERWYSGDTANLSIGQGYLSVTPLQILRMVACVANGGWLVEPHVLNKEYKRVKLNISDANIEAVRMGLEGVVEGGTGVNAWSSVVSISGKTGTSQAGGGVETHAWFSGYAPSRNPEISFVIFLEHGGSGGDMPALIVKKAVEYWYINRR